MPTPQPAPFTAGTVISAATVAAGVTAARDYLNGGIVDSDFDAEGIGFEDLARPVILGYPFLVMDGEFQSSLFRTRGLSDSQAPQNQRYSDPTDNFLAREVERTSVFPKITDAADHQVVQGSGARFDVDEDGIVDILLNVKLETVLSVATGASADCGTVFMYYRNNTADPASIGTQLVGTRKGLTSDSGNRSMTWYEFTSQFEVTAGTYDVWLMYISTGVDATLAQVIASGPTLEVELHITG